MQTQPIYVEDELFLGRLDEQDYFRDVLRTVLYHRDDDAPPYIFLLHGPGGIGKSQLTRRLHDIAQSETPFAERFQVLRVDWEEVRYRTPALRVGRDQIQHVEMARDIGQRFNHLFGNGKEFFTMPEALIEESVATLPGLDGRKMSKSYDNTIPLFTSAKDMKDAISRIVTDSRAPGEAKDPDNSHLFTLYQAFATKAQEEEFRGELLQGLGWGEAKNRLFQLLDSQLGEARERYHN